MYNNGSTYATAENNHINIIASHTCTHTHNVNKCNTYNITVVWFLLVSFLFISSAVEQFIDLSAGKLLTTRQTPRQFLLALAFKISPCMFMTWTLCYSCKWHTARKRLKLAIFAMIKTTQNQENQKHKMYTENIKNIAHTSPLK